MAVTGRDGGSNEDRLRSTMETLGFEETQINQAVATLQQVLKARTRRAAAEGEELHAAAVARAGDVHAREADREAGRE